MGVLRRLPITPRSSAVSGASSYRTEDRQSLFALGHRTSIFSLPMPPSAPDSRLNYQLIKTPRQCWDLLTLEALCWPLESHASNLIINNLLNFSKGNTVMTDVWLVPQSELTFGCERLQWTEEERDTVEREGQQQGD
ncbi:hypothetical protein WMY93_014864 [Mugilogobius chulae]|uniref:Uncharacterized protein n=1 Tax=Mugilogobius chulae TaxID=88201 RepID=A0AAW0P2D3_9GOBI